MAKYKLNRKEFLEWMLADDVDKLAATEDLRADLIASGEFIITAQELLDTCGYIPGHLVWDSDEEVDPTDCELVYNGESV